MLFFSLMEIYSNYVSNYFFVFFFGFLHFPTDETFNDDDSNNDQTEGHDTHNSSYDQDSQRSQESPLRPPPNMFATPPFMEADGRWDDSQNNSFNGPAGPNPFNTRGSMSEPPKRANPFSEKPSPHEMIQMERQQMMAMQQRNSNPGFNNQRPFMHSGVPGTPGPRPDMDPFMNSPRGPPQFMPQQPMNFRGGPNRNNGPSPYFRNPKGGGGGPPAGNMRGGFRPNFRGRNW